MTSTRTATAPGSSGAADHAANDAAGGVSMYAVAGAAQEAVTAAVEALGVFAQARPDSASQSSGMLGGASGLGTAAVGVPTSELGELCGQLWRLRALAEGAAVAVALQAVERGVVAESAAVDVADWVRQCAWAAGVGLPPGLAAAVKTVSGHARVTRPTDLRPLAAAVLTAQVPVATARPLGRQLDLLARRVDDAVWHTAASELIGWASQGVTNGDLRTARQRIEAAYATGAFEEEQESAHRHRDLSGWVGDDAGGWSCRLRTDNEGKAILDAVFDALAAPSAEVAAAIAARPPVTAATPTPTSAPTGTGTVIPGRRGGYGPSLAAALAFAGRDPAPPLSCPTCGARFPSSHDPRRGDEPRGDGPRSDGPRSDGPRSDGPRSDGPRSDGPRGDGGMVGGGMVGGCEVGPMDQDGFAARAWRQFEAAYAATDPGALDPFTAAARRSLATALAAEQAGWSSADQAAFGAWQTPSTTTTTTTTTGASTNSAATTTWPDVAAAQTVDNPDASARDAVDRDAERAEQQAILDLGRDTRTPGQRRHDALLDMARVVATDPTLMRQTRPAAAVKAQVTITIDYDYLRALLAAHTATTTGSTGTTSPTGTTGSAETTGTDAGCSTTGAMGMGTAGAAGPSPSGTPRRGAGVDGHGTPLTAATVRRMCCDAALIPTVLGADGAILDWGRSRRLASPDQVRYLRHRDKGCTYPGCTRPPAWTEAHHLDEWLLDHGETNVTTLALLCARHHDIVHTHHLKGDLIDGAVRWRRRTRT